MERSIELTGLEVATRLSSLQLGLAALLLALFAAWLWRARRSENRHSD